MKRACGILLPVSSLSGNYGIGGFSKEAYEFVDKLKHAGQSYWQILPLSPTGYGDSPYQSGSAFAGNMNYIALDELAEAGFFEKEELEEIDWGKDSAQVDYKSANPNINISIMLFFLLITFSLLKNKKIKISKLTKFCILYNNILQEIQKKLNTKNGVYKNFLCIFCYF